MSLILPWLFSFFFSPATSIKLAMVFSTLFFIITFYYVARIYLPSLYSLLFSLVIITPMFDNIVSGMWYNYFSLGCGLLFWRSSWKFLITQSRHLYLLAALSLAGAFYSHPVGVILCAAIFITCLIIILCYHELNKIRLLFIYLTIPCISVLLAFPQLQTILGLDAVSTSIIKEAGIHEYPVTGLVETLRRLFFIRVWGGISPSTFNKALMGVNIFSVLLLSGFGVFALVKNKDSKKLLPITILFAITVILISRAYNYFNINSGVLHSLSNFYDRFQLLSQIYLTLLAGLGIYFLAQRSLETIKNYNFFKPLFFILIASIITIAVRTPHKIFLHQTGQFGTLESSNLVSHVHDLWNWINNNVNTQSERIYFEDTYGKFTWNSALSPESEKTHLLALTSIFTNTRQIGGWCGFSSKFASRYEQGTAFGKSAGDKDFTNDFIAERMRLLNCKYIIAYSDALVNRLTTVPFLYKKAVFGIFHVFEKADMKPAWAYNIKTGASAEMKRYSATHFEIIANGAKGDDIHISMRYHPNYIATTNQAAIPVNNQKSLINITLPRDGKQSIHFNYTFKKQIALYLLFSGILLLSVMTFFLPHFVPLPKGTMPSKGE